MRPNTRRFGTPAVPAAAAIGPTNSRDVAIVPKQRRARFGEGQHPIALESAVLMDPDALSINTEVLGLEPKETCLKYKLVPLDRIGNSLVVAVSEKSCLRLIASTQSP